LSLTACGGSTVSADRPALIAGPRLDPAPAALTQEVPAPVLIPERRLSAGDVERLWGEDRAHLKEARSGKRALLRYYERRDAALGAAIGGEK
jgi:hypothetical protein